MSIIILGSGAFAREAYDWVIASGKSVIGFYSGLKNEATELRGKPIYYSPRDIPSTAKWIMGSGNPKAMKSMISDIADFIQPAPAIIHPTCIIGTNVTIGNGSIICPGNILTCDITIGESVVINLGCTIGHDVKIGNLVHLSPNTSLSGYVKVGNHCELGTGVSVIPSIEITDNCIIGAGSVITKPALEAGVYVGAPAKKIK